MNLNQQEINQVKQASNQADDPLVRLKEMEEREEEQERLFKEREKQLLLEIANQQDKNKLARKIRDEALNAKQVAEYKFLNQQKEQINGINQDDGSIDTPAQRSKRLFAKVLEEKRERSVKKFNETSSERKIHFVS